MQEPSFLTDPSVNHANRCLIDSFLRNPLGLPVSEAVIRATRGETARKTMPPSNHSIITIVCPRESDPWFYIYQTRPPLFPPFLLRHPVPRSTRKRCHDARFPGHVPFCNAGARGRREGKVTKMVALMITAFMFAWSPYAALALAAQYFDVSTTDARLLLSRISSRLSRSTTFNEEGIRRRPESTELRNRIPRGNRVTLFHPPDRLPLCLSPSLPIDSVKSYSRRIRLWSKK